MTTNDKKFVISINFIDDIIDQEEEQTELIECNRCNEEEEEEDKEINEFIGIVAEIIKLNLDEEGILVAVIILKSFYSTNIIRIESNKYFLNAGTESGFMYETPIITKEGEKVLRNEIFFGAFDYIIEYLTEEGLSKK